MSLRIGFVYDGDYPWDVRVWKMTAALRAAGAAVHVIARNDARRPRHEVVEGVEIHRLPAGGPRALHRAANFPAFFNPVWIASIARLVRAHRLDALIVRDLPLSLTAIGVGRALGVPVVVDMAENYPEMLRDAWTYDRMGPLDVVVRSPRVARQVERLAIRLADRVLVVIEEAHARLVRAGADPGRLAIVRNTPPLDLADFPADWPAQRPADDRLIVTFVGGLEPMRGLDEVLAMWREAVPALPGLLLRIVGGGRWQGELEARVRDLGLGRHVEFTGRLPYQQALHTVALGDVGIIPHRITAHTSSTIPNKLFEYMLLAQPVLATDMAPVRRIVTDVDCGRVYADRAEGLAALRALADPTLRAKLGANGRRAVREAYHWGCDAGVLLDTLRAVVRPGAFDTAVR